MMTVCKSVFVCVSPIKLLKQLTDFHESWYEFNTIANPIFFLSVSSDT
jgi:hypothetical protein